MKEYLKENKIKHKISVIVNKDQVKEFVEKTFKIKIEGKVDEVYLSIPDYRESNTLSISSIKEDRLKEIEHKTKVK